MHSLQRKSSKLAVGLLSFNGRLRCVPSLVKAHSSSTSLYNMRPLSFPTNSYAFSSTEQLWRSDLNPMSESDRSRYSPYFDFKYTFGQGGKLTLRLLKSPNPSPVHIQTLWEDYTTVHVFTENNKTHSALPTPAYTIEESAEESGRFVTFSDESFSDLPADLHFRAYACMPEYYSYDIESNGPIIHENTSAVSSKIYGDVRAITPMDFIAKKLKTEICEISAKTASIDTYVEALTLSLTAANNITIKKCAVSGTALIQVIEKGDVDISALFTNQQRTTDITSTPEATSSNSTSSSSRSAIDELEAKILKKSHVKIHVNEGNIHIGSTHGATVLSTKQGNITLDHVANQDIVVSAQHGHVQAHFYHIKNDSYIKATTAKISLEESFAQNVFLVRDQVYLNGSNDPNQATLFIDASINASEITRIKGFSRSAGARQLPSFMLNNK